MQIAFRLNLEQQKKRAKELLKEFQRDQATAISRFEQQHPKLINKEHTVTTFEAKLADAQLVIARECGCKSWNRLRSHIVLMDSLRGRINRADVVADEPAGCLHIRCGSDIKRTLSEAGFKGDFLEFSDPFCVGPVDYDYLIEKRAQFLCNSYGAELEQDYNSTLEGLTDAYRRFQNSASHYGHVVLWFEHDAYDQFILIFLLSQYHRFGLPENLWIVTTNEFPGSARFQGLGQLPPEGLRLLWQTRQPVTTSQCAEADRHWAAYTNRDRTMFHEHIQKLADSTLPYFKTAALRQMQEQPVQNGQLPLTQQFTIELLTESAPQSAGRLFVKVMEQKEPLPFLGDLMYWNILLQMKARGLVRFTAESDHWPETVVDLN